MLKKHETLYILKRLKYSETVRVGEYHISRQNHDTPGFAVEISVRQHSSNMLVQPDDSGEHSFPGIYKMKWTIDYK